MVEDEEGEITIYPNVLRILWNLSQRLQGPRDCGLCFPSHWATSLFFSDSLGKAEVNYKAILHYKENWDETLEDLELRDGQAG